MRSTMKKIDAGVYVTDREFSGRWKVRCISRTDWAVERPHMGVVAHVTDLQAGERLIDEREARARNAAHAVTRS